MKRLLAVLATALTLILLGCAAKGTPKPLPTGALNAFDANSYVTLMGAQAVINSAKADIANLPPAAKPALNSAIASYNIAEAAWQSYHSCAKNGGVCDTATVTTAITQATTNVTTLLTSISGGK